MTKAVLEVRLLTPADWRLLRDTRLRALRDSPRAFLADHVREHGWAECQWRRRFDGATWVVAVERDPAAAGNEEVIGIAALIDGQPTEGPHIESIWVDPAHRRRGIFRMLISAVIEIGRLDGIGELLLWVLEDNTIARGAYADLGFVRTGERQAIPPTGERYEVRLRLMI